MSNFFKEAAAPFIVALFLAIFWLIFQKQQIRIEYVKCMRDNATAPGVGR
jgi:hypothetical protein